MAADPPVFPHVHETLTSRITHHGISRRELFAMVALHGYLSNNSFDRASFIAAAHHAVAQADALIKELGE